MFTRDFLWLTQFARACLHKFTPVYLCFPLFTHKRGDLGIVFHSEIYVSQMLHVKLKLYKIKSTLLQCSIFWTIALLHLCTLLHRCTVALFHSFTVALHCFTVALFHHCTVSPLTDKHNTISKSLHISVYLCLPLFRCFYLGLALFTRSCLPMYTRLFVFTYVYNFLPMFNLAYSCLSMFIRVFLCSALFNFAGLPMFVLIYFYHCLPVLIYVSSHMFAHVYTCLPVFSFLLMFTLVNICLPLFSRACYLCLLFFTRSYLC